MYLKMLIFGFKGLIAAEALLVVAILVSMYLLGKFKYLLEQEWWNNARLRTLETHFGFALLTLTCAPMAVLVADRVLFRDVEMSALRIALPFGILFSLSVTSMLASLTHLWEVLFSPMDEDPEHCYSASN